MSTDIQTAATQAKNAILANVDAYAASIGLTMTARFIPQSLSRNAGGRPSLNWKITLTTTASEPFSLMTDYTQGIGNVPGYPHPYNINAGDFKHECDLAAETGVYPIHPQTLHEKMQLPPPTLTEVIYSLVLDAEVLDCNSFEEWAADMGYDTDSRAAEKRYSACREIAAALQRLIGTEAIEKFRELTQEY